MARVAKKLEGVEEERKGVDSAIARLLTLEEELRALDPRTQGQDLELASVRNDKSKLLDIKSKLLEKESKLLDKESKLLEKENLLQGKALPAAGAWVPPRAPIAFE